ncbi:MAG: DNA translocase FtsK, partial [Chloroflexi bacterium]|nr:DNA translocase FtsK [Chloroflexota bacterium]
MLEEVTAGGDLGHLLAGNPIGIIVWAATGFATFAVVSPVAAAAVLAGVRTGAAAVWGWRIPQRTVSSARGLIDLVFPTRPPPRGTEKIPLDSVIWAQESESSVAVETAAEAVAEPEPPAPPPDTGEQAALPLDGETGDGGPRKAHDNWQLPPLDVLRDVRAQDGQPDNAMRARQIIETLASFGVDAKVIQVNEGPTVTQFGLEPGWDVKTRQVTERDAAGKPVLGRDGQPKVHAEEVSRTRVRVNQITSLANDLALALAAPSLRIESPVPGKPFVGIEVPNHNATLVTLRSVVESAQFRRMSARSRLVLALGQSVAGEPIVADLAKMPHLLIAGATGSGKSVCINSIIACLLMHASPEE